LEDKVPFHLYHSCITPRPFQACAAKEFGYNRSIIRAHVFEEKSLLSAVNVH